MWDLSTSCDEMFQRVFSQSYADIVLCSVPTWDDVLVLLILHIFRGPSVGT